MFTNICLYDDNCCPPSPGPIGIVRMNASCFNTCREEQESLEHAMFNLKINQQIKHALPSVCIMIIVQASLGPIELVIRKAGCFC